MRGLKTILIISFLILGSNRDNREKKDGIFDQLSPKSPIASEWYQTDPIQQDAKEGRFNDVIKRIRKEIKGTCVERSIALANRLEVPVQVVVQERNGRREAIHFFLIYDDVLLDPHPEGYTSEVRASFPDLLQEWLELGGVVPLGNAKIMQIYNPSIAFQANNLLELHNALEGDPLPNSFRSYYRKYIMPLLEEKDFTTAIHLLNTYLSVNQTMGIDNSSIQQRVDTLIQTINFLQSEQDFIEESI